MATSVDFIEYVCDQVRGIGNTRYRKMFGEYMVYINDKPVLLVCDNTVYVKQVEPVYKLMKQASCGYPYKGSKEHYILDIDNASFSKEVAVILEEITPVPKIKKKKQETMVK